MVGDRLTQTRITDDKGQTLVVASRNLVSRIQAETRNLVSDLRDPAELAGDLAAVLADDAAHDEQAEAGTG